MSSLLPMHSIVSGASFGANTHCPVHHPADTVVIPACLCFMAIVLLFDDRLFRNSTCLGNTLNGTSTPSSALNVDR